MYRCYISNKFHVYTSMNGDCYLTMILPNKPIHTLHLAGKVTPLGTMRCIFRGLGPLRAQVSQLAHWPMRYKFCGSAPSLCFLILFLPVESHGINFALHLVPWNDNETWSLRKTNPDVQSLYFQTGWSSRFPKQSTKKPASGFRILRLTKHGKTKFQVCHECLLHQRQLMHCWCLNVPTCDIMWWNRASVKGHSLSRQYFSTLPRIERYSGIYLWMWRDLCGALSFPMM